MANFFDNLLKVTRKIKTVDRMMLSCIVTGSIFLMFALIQIIIIAVGSTYIEFGDVILIVTDLAVAVIAGLIAIRRINKSHAKENDDKVNVTEKY